MPLARGNSNPMCQSRDRNHDEAHLQKKVTPPQRVIIESLMTSRYEAEFKGKLAFSIEDAIFYDDLLVAPDGRSGLRLSERGRELVMLAQSEAYRPVGDVELSFFLRLLDLGVAKVSQIKDPLENIDAKYSDHAPSISFVVPHYNDPIGLSKTLTSIRAYAEIQNSWGVIEVIIVDDGSRGELSIEPFIDTLIKHQDSPIIISISLGKNGGPAKARNVGAQRAMGDLIVFVDCGVTFDSGIDSLLTIAASSIAGIVAPRIRCESEAASAKGALLYQMINFPLDAGNAAGSVGRGGPSYLPSTLLIVDRALFDSNGGFDEDMRYGEDVDFVRRIAKSGGRCYYDPSIIATHPPRRNIKSLALQAFRYGSSMAPLYRTTEGEIFQFPRGWINLAQLSTVTARLIFDLKGSLTKRRRQGEFDDPIRSKEASAANSLTLLRRSYGFAEFAIKLIVAAIAGRSLLKQRILKGKTVSDYQLKKMVLLRSKEPFTLRSFAKQKSSVKRRSKWVLLILGLEATLHFGISVREFKSMVGNHKKNTNTRDSLSGNDEITNHSEAKKCRTFRTLFGATTTSITYDLSYNMGVAVGSWREKLLPISKL